MIGVAVLSCLWFWYLTAKWGAGDCLLDWRTLLFIFKTPAEALWFPLCECRCKHAYLIKTVHYFSTAMKTLFEVGIWSYCEGKDLISTRSCEMIPKCWMYFAIHSTCYPWLSKHFQEKLKSWRLEVFAWNKLTESQTQMLYWARWLGNPENKVCQEKEEA